LQCLTSWLEEDSGPYATQMIQVLNRTFRPDVPNTPVNKH